MFLRKSSISLIRPRFVEAYNTLHYRSFHISSAVLAVKPVLLTDIGEGIVECEIIQWFVQPGARVEEFSKLCEVQSDKASVEITSRFSGVVKKLCYEAGEMVQVGKAFVEIDIQGGPDEAATPKLTEELSSAVPTPIPDTSASKLDPTTVDAAAALKDKKRVQNNAIAAPAVRHFIREHDLDITQINGTGKDGRVLKEDVFAHLKAREANIISELPNNKGDATVSKLAVIRDQVETIMPLNPIQAQMFKTMTKSLSIPHFLYADEVDFTVLRSSRARINNMLQTSQSTISTSVTKLSYLPFIIKAMSIALTRYPILNARLDTSGAKPCLVLRSQHNIGVAMDTPSGLMVPVIKDIASRSLVSIAQELNRLQDLGNEGKLSPQDMSDGTFTLSNIGTVGGTYTAPVIVEKEVAIVGIGKMRRVPAFGGEDGNKIVEKFVWNFSWSADHRAVDGATVARASELVRKLIEDPELMMMYMQ